MYIIFTDKSEARWSPLNHLWIDSEFLGDTKAIQLFSMFSMLKDGETYKFKKFLATLKVDKSDQLFVRMFVEDHFPGVKFIGHEIPEVPYPRQIPGVHFD